jgi:hypothetical protein
MSVIETYFPAGTVADPASACKSLFQKTLRLTHLFAIFCGDQQGVRPAKFNEWSILPDWYEKNGTANSRRLEFLPAGGV